jgi:hypothetical protein
MQTYAYIQPDTTVYTIIQGPDGFSPSDCYRGPLPAGEWIAAPDDIEPGDTCADGAFVKAPRPIQPITKLAFLRRFTAEERIAIRASADPVIVDFMALLDLAEDVRVDDPDTTAAVSYLTVMGLLADGRADEILSTN